jgi:acetoin utilization protein AcuB
MIGREASLAEALELMDELGIRHLPVVEGKKIVGIVSDRDIHLLKSLKGVESHHLHVDDAMTPHPYHAAPDAPLEEVAAVMADRKLGSALVMENGRVVGIFTAVDGLRVLAEILEGRDR